MEPAGFGILAGTVLMFPLLLTALSQLTTGCKNSKSYIFSARWYSPSVQETAEPASEVCTQAFAAEPQGKAGSQDRRRKPSPSQHQQAVHPNASSSQQVEKAETDGICVLSQSAVPATSETKPTQNFDASKPLSKGQKRAQRNWQKKQEALATQAAQAAAKASAVRSAQSALKPAPRASASKVVASDKQATKPDSQSPVKPAPAKTTSSQQAPNTPSKPTQQASAASSSLPLPFINAVKVAEAAAAHSLDTPARRERIKSYRSLVENQIADWTEPLYTILRNERNPALYNWGRDAMHSLSLKVIRIATDGNCMFRAVALQLFGDDKYHASVRARAVEELRSRPSFRAFFCEDMNEYLRKMSRDREFGTHLLRAIANAYNVVIDVLDPYMASRVHTVEPEGMEGTTEVTKLPHVVLFYNGDGHSGHYDGVGTRDEPLPKRHTVGDLSFSIVGRK